MSANIGMIGLMATQRLLYDIEDKSYKEDFTNLFKKSCHSKLECEDFKTEPVIVVKEIITEGETLYSKTYKVSFKKLSQNYIIENVRPYTDFRTVIVEIDFLLIPMSNTVPTKPIIVDFINTSTGERFSKVFSDFKIEQ